MDSGWAHDTVTTIYAIHSLMMMSHLGSFPVGFIEARVELSHVVSMDPYNSIILSLQNLHIGSIMEPTHKKIENIDQRLIIQPLRGGNLLYITQMNNSCMIQMTKPHFYIKESKGSQYNQVDLTIII